jgi:hypothetical protein
MKPSFLVIERPKLPDDPARNAQIGRPQRCWMAFFLGPPLGCRITAKEHLYE